MGAGLASQPAMTGPRSVERNRDARFHAAGDLRLIEDQGGIRASTARWSRQSGLRIQLGANQEAGAVMVDLIDARVERRSSGCRRSAESSALESS